MKKTLVLLCTMLMGMISMAQSMNEIKTIALLPTPQPKQKETIDKFMSNEKNTSKAESWYYKGLIYNRISKIDSFKSKCADCRMEAFEAFKKYQEMDPKNELMLSDKNVQLFDIYGNYFDDGAKTFNNKAYDTAFEDFKKALLVKDYIYSKGFEASNGFKFASLDTSLVLNTAISAVLAKKDSLAIPYYNKLINAGLNDKQYLNAYQIVTEYYKKRRDDVAFYAAIEKGKKAFPNEDYWMYIELEYIREPANKKEVFSGYEEIFNKYPDSYLVGYDYSVQLYNYLYANDDSAAVIDTSYKSVFKNTLTKTIAIKSTGEANILMARAIYNNYYEMSDAAKKIRGPKPADLAKRKAMLEAAGKERDACIPYFETANAYFAALPTLKPIERANYKQSLGFLLDIYQSKNNAAKVAEITEKMKSM